MLAYSYCGCRLKFSHRGSQPHCLVFVEIHLYYHVLVIGCCSCKTHKIDPSRHGLPTPDHHHWLNTLDLPTVTSSCAHYIHIPCSCCPSAQTTLSDFFKSHPIECGDFQFSCQCPSFCVTTVYHIQSSSKFACYSPRRTRPGGSRFLCRCELLLRDSKNMNQPHLEGQSPPFITNNPECSIDSRISAEK